MNKVKRKELVEKANEHELRLFQIEKALEQHGINWFAEEPKLKQLDQSVFDHEFVTDHFKYAALNSNGQSIFFSDKPKYDLELGIWYSTAGSTMPMLKGYDTTDWQNSLIERDIAKELLEVDLSSELTGSDLARAMLARGDYHVMCAVSDISESDAILSCNSAVITSGEIRGAFTNSFDGFHEHAVPINNQGEPLTASEVGL